MYGLGQYLVENLESEGAKNIYWEIRILLIKN